MDYGGPMYTSAEEDVEDRVRLYTQLYTTQQLIDKLTEVEARIRRPTHPWGLPTVSDLVTKIVLELAIPRSHDVLPALPGNKMMHPDDFAAGVLSDFRTALIKEEV